MWGHCIVNIPSHRVLVEIFSKALAVFYMHYKLMPYTALAFVFGKAHCRVADVRDVCLCEFAAALRFLLQMVEFYIKNSGLHGIEAAVESLIDVVVTVV